MANYVNIRYAIKMIIQHLRKVALMNIKETPIPTVTTPE